MVSGLMPKVRFVICPKCRKVLSEPADIPVYKCGGCDAVLRAKNQQIDDAESTSGLHETDAAKINESDNVSEYKESSRSSHGAVLPSSGECSLDQNDGSGQNESVECNSEQLGDVNLSNEDQNIENQQYESWDCNTRQSGVSNEVCSSTELAHHENKEFSPLVEANSDVELDDESTLLAGVESGVEINNKSASDFRSSTTDNLPLATRESNSVVTAHRPADNLVSSPKKQPKQPQKSGRHSFNRFMSTDTFESTDFLSANSELSDTLEYLSKSPTTRSSHAYDGSISSYDGRDDQFPDQHMDSVKNTYKDARFVVHEERLRRDKFLVNSMINSNPEVQQQPRNSSSVFSNEKHYAIKHSRWDRDELLEPSRHGHPVRNWTRLARNEYQSQVPFYPRGSLAGYESGSSSNQLHDEFHCNSSLHSLETPEFSGQDKMKLLRMVSELQDQLNKTSFLNGKTSGRAVPVGVNWKEKHIPMYYDHKASEQIYHNLNYPRYPGRQGQGGGWSQQSKCSRRPFSGEAKNSRYQVDHSCLRCHPQDWQCSGQFPVPVVPHNSGFRRIHPSNSCYDSCSSCPSSPLRYMGSEFPMWNREAQSDDQRHRDNSAKLYPRERHHVVKRHLLPTAGGAPFVTCYCCLKPLQLPADFLLFKRRCHLLKCGACSQVLKFSLRDGSHIVRYTPCAVDPQPSHVDDFSDSVNDSTNLASASYGNDCSHADPVSCSDDYGLSFCKSFSTDGDPVSLAPFRKSQGSRDVRNISYDSSETMGERSEVLLKQSRSKYKNPGETFESAGNSSNMSKPEKVSSENGELPPARASPLHQLMGYSSPSAVLRGTELVDTATSSYYPEENPMSKRVMLLQNIWI